MSISGISGMDSYYYLSQLMRQSSSSSSSSTTDLFNTIDTNGDDSISESELTSGLESSSGGLASSVLGSQTDSTSLVSLLEDAAQLDAATGTTTSADELFSKISDGGSSISESQFESYVESLSGQSGSSTSGSSATSSSDASAIDQLFSAIDTNGDGSISESEFESYVESLESAMSAPPPPPPPPPQSNSTSSLDSLLQSLGVNSGTDSGTTSTTSATTSSSSTSSTSSTSDQTNSASALMALLMEAIGKYMQFAQSGTGTANTVTVTG